MQPPLSAPSLSAAPAGHKRRRAFTVWLSLLACALACGVAVAPAPAAATPPAGEAVAPSVRRAALVVAAHDGGPGRSALAHAARDAEKFAEVMRELGGVGPQDAVVVLDPTPEGLRAGFVELQRRLDVARTPGQRVEVVFYYSGHSDEQGLLLGGERLGYRELRAAADGLRADVRIMVLDSCSAGALTRAKGGTRQPPFLVGEASNVTGHAFLTSSSEDEAAQESDLIGGSFFTHYLVTGLRGAADVSGDGRVTLSEAYQFAFQETLRRTQSTRSGPQHPVYEIQLTGTSDLVLTDLRAPSATLRLSEGMEGRVFVHRDQPGAELMAELGKPAGRSAALKLPAGAYVLRLDRGASSPVGESRFVVGVGEEVTLDPDALALVGREPTTARGDGPPSASPAQAVPLGEVLPRDGVYVSIPVHVGLVPGVGLNDWLVPDGMTADNALAMHVLVGGGARVRGVMMAGLVGWTDETVSGLMAAGLGNVGGAVHGFAGAGAFNAHTVVEGVQGAGAVNVAEQVHGAQMGGAVNVAEQVHGAQMGGAVNVAEQVHGVQMGGAVNVAGDVRGAQLGLINIGGHVSGAQVGFINIADSADAPIGLINIIGDGIQEGALWMSETAHVNAGVKLGGRYIYGILSGGAFFRGLALDSDGFGSDDVLFEVAAGIGGRIPLWADALHLDIDLTQSHFGSPTQWYSEVNLARLRATVGWRLLPHLSVFAGLSVGALLQWGNDSVSLTGGVVTPYVVYDAATDAPDRLKTEEPSKVSLFPGFVLGVGF